jgi:hypothetical protein
MPQYPLGIAYAKTAGNKFAALLSDSDGSLRVTDAAPNTFLAANPSGVTTSAGLATTYVGIVLSNPAGSGVNLIIRRVAGQFIVAPATVTGFNLITGYAAGGITVHTTPLAPFSRIIGTGPAPLAKVDSAATLVGTPVYTMALGETTLATELASFNYDLEGSIILPPGAYAAIGTTIAGPASGFIGSFQWEEATIAAA